MTKNKKTSKEIDRLVDNPAISISTHLGKIYAKEVEFTQSAKLIQNAADAKCSGATVWLEAEFESLIIDGVSANRSMFDTQRVSPSVKYATV